MRAADGEVCNLTVRLNYQVFARKLLRPFGGVTTEDIANEARAVTKLCSPGAHENIVEVCHHGWLPSPASEYYFIDMEYCVTTLEEHINENLPVGGHWDRVYKAIRTAEDITRG